MSELVLAIDTSTESGSLALLRGDELLEEVKMRSPEGFAHVLFGEIEALLARHAVSLTEIDLFASSSGPGSFTGVRVGLTATKGLAEAAGKRVVAISNLHAMASFGTRPLRAVTMNARRGEYYCAVYNNALEIVQDEVVTKLETFLSNLPVADLDLIVEAAGFASENCVRPPDALAGAIGRLALKQFRLGLAKDPSEIDANYVRRSDAELFWKDPAAI